MENTRYSPDKLISNYIASCQEVNEPLNKCQVGVLEQTVIEYFDLYTKHTLESVGINETGRQPFDTATFSQVADVIRYKMPGNLTNAIKRYKYGKVDDCLEISDADAVDLYSFVTREIKHRNLSEIKKKTEFPHSFGRSAFKALHYYLQLKGYVDYSEELPREPRSRRFAPSEPDSYSQALKEAVFKIIE